MLLLNKLTSSNSKCTLQAKQQEEMRMFTLISLLMIVLVNLNMFLPALGQGTLDTGFYSSSCPKAESVVRSTVKSHFDNDATIAAALLRLHFHDCFVQVMQNLVLSENIFLGYYVCLCCYVSGTGV